MAKVGRPLKFETVEILQTKIDDYFATCPEDEWTITGLALHLDTDRFTLIHYEERTEFIDAVKKAKQKVENGYEKDLKKHGRAGTIFALKNFDWNDRQEIKHEISQGFLNIDPLADAPTDNSTPENITP